jgi:hypothetical protein
MSGSALTIELPLGTFLTLGPEAVDAFETAIREQRRVDRPKRDLAAEIEVFLSRNGAATVPEIGRALGARDSSVRQTLQTDDRFNRAPAAAGRSPRARRWSLVPGPSRPGRAGRTSKENEGA